MEELDIGLLYGGSFPSSGSSAPPVPLPSTAEAMHTLGLATENPELTESQELQESTKWLCAAAELVANCVVLEIARRSGRKDTQFTDFIAGKSVHLPSVKLSDGSTVALSRVATDKVGQHFELVGVDPTTGDRLTDGFSMIQNSNGYALVPHLTAQVGPNESTVDQQRQQLASAEQILGEYAQAFTINKLRENTEWRVENTCREIRGEKMTAEESFELERSFIMRKDPV